MSDRPATTETDAILYVRCTETEKQRMKAAKTLSGADSMRDWILDHVVDDTDRACVPVDDAVLRDLAMVVDTADLEDANAAIKRLIATIDPHELSDGW